MVQQMAIEPCAAEGIRQEAIAKNTRYGAMLGNAIVYHRGGVLVPVLQQRPQSTKEWKHHGDAQQPCGS